MSTVIDNAFVREFRDAVVMLAEQTTNRLRAAVTVSNVTGEMWAAERLGGVSAGEIGTRFEQIGRGDASHTRRWGVVRAFDVRPLFFDSIDQVKVLVNFESRYLRVLAAAMARAQDDAVIGALDGPVTEGKTAGSTATFPAAQTIFNFATGTTPGPLNLNTLLAAKARLLAAEATVEPNALVTVLLNANAWLSLMRDPAFTSGDFSRFFALETGDLPPFLGMQFIRSERLPDLSDAAYDGGAAGNRVFMFTKTAVEFGDALAVQADVSRRRDLRAHPWQAYVWGAWGAVRLEDVQVVRILARRA